MATDYTTYDDLVQHLVLRYSLTPSGQPLAHAMVAVREAYRRLFAIHDWNYFRRFELVHVVGTESTGTIEYTHSTRTVTLTGSTWPTNAQYGDLKIDDVRYHIEYRESSTEVVLPENFNPGEDIAAGETYEWAQHRYPLSFEVGDITEIIDPANPHPLVQIDVRTTMFLIDNYNAQTYPTTYTMFPSQHNAGLWELWFPTDVYSDRKVKIMYDARHSPLRTMHEKGISLATSGQVATFPAGKLTSDHIGCVLRISSDDQTPTSQIGRMDDGSQEWGLNPFSQERVIVAVSGNDATLSASVDTVTDNGWSISQLIDVDAGVMTTFILRLCENEYAKIADIDTKTLQLSDHWMMKALVEAQMDDSRKLKPRSGVIPNNYPYRVGDIASVTI